MGINLPNPKAGETWAQQSAASWNELVDRVKLQASRINRLEQQIVRLTPVIPKGIAYQFRIDELDDDIDKDFTRSTLYPVPKNGPLVKIVKPYLLRMTPFDGKTIDDVKYEYDSPSARTLTKVADGTSEDQVVVPAYHKDDYIYAIPLVVGGTDVFEKPEDGNKALGWLDLNIDGRAWAKKSGSSSSSP